MKKCLLLMFLAFSIAPANAKDDPPKRAPEGAEPRIEYSTFGDLYGKPSMVKLAADGSHFLALYFPETSRSVLRLWRIEGEEAFQVRSWVFKGEEMLRYLWLHAAVAPGGKYVAINQPRAADEFGGKISRLSFYRVKDNDREQFKEGKIGHNSDRRNESCGLEFLDSDRLLACRKGWDKAGEPRSTLALISGFEKNDIELSDQKELGFSKTGNFSRFNGETLVATGISHTTTTPDDHTTVQISSGKIAVLNKAGQPGGPVYRSGIFGKAFGLVSARPDGVTILAAGQINAGMDKKVLAYGGFPHFLASSPDGRLILEAGGEAWLVGKSGLQSLLGRSAAASKPKAEAQSYQYYNDSVQIEFSEDSVFLQSAEAVSEVLTVGNSRIERRRISRERLQAAALREEGMAMLKAGFFAAGFGKLREAVDADPGAWTQNSAENSETLAISVSTGQLKAPIAEAGKFLQHLAHALSAKAPGARLNIPFGSGLALGKLKVCEGGSHPLEAAGFSEGDRLSAVNGKPLVTAAEYESFLKGLQPGGTVEITITKKDGTAGSLKLPALMAWKWHRGHYYANTLYLGILAAQAGHPGVTLQAEAVIRKLVEDQEFCPGVKGAANLLGGLARAVNQGAEAGYEYILANGGLVISGDRVSGAGHAERFAAALAPLYTDRKKMAFLMDIPPEKLPYPKFIAHDSAAFPDLAGQMIERKAPAEGQRKPDPSSKKTGNGQSKGKAQSGGRILE